MLAGLLCSLYLILFVLGMGSNLTALIRTIRIYRLIKRFDRSSGGQSNIRVGHFIGFALVLIITNLSLLLCLCFLISDVLSQGWHLGSTLCWFYWWSENIAKTFVAFMLSAFSVERYLCSLNQSIWKSITGNCLLVPMLILFGSIVAVILAGPLQPYVGVQMLTVDPTSPTATYETSNMTKCGISEQIPKFALKYHVIGSFLFAYLLPLIVFVFCYISIMRSSKKTGSMSNEDPTDRREARLASASTTSTSTVIVERVEAILKKITMISTSLVVLHLICWTPYWVTTLIIQFGDTSYTTTFNLPFTLFVCHVLPYVSATVAGLLFVAMAKRVKLVKLSDMITGGGTGQGEGANGENGTYHEMATRDTLHRSNSSVEEN